MKPEHKDHLKGYGPMYAIMLFFAGGGTTAMLTDNIPVTNSQFLAWTESHVSAPHQASSEQIDMINDQLKAIQLEGVRAQLSKAYADKCRAQGASLEYIDREIQRLEDVYFALTKRKYDPPPCN